MSLGAERIGALIVVERETGLQDTAETGVMIDAELSLELLETIFTPHSPLHDGAVIVRHERVVSAGVVLPLSDTGVYRERFGTRHRAALGITEQTDAVAVVVSEETGAVSLVERGRIVRNLDEQRLVQGLVDLLENNHLAAARIPTRATALRRTLPLRRSARAGRATETPSATSAHAGGAPAGGAPAATTSGRVE
jgi:diadenylate cyclase